MFIHGETLGQGPLAHDRVEPLAARKIQHRKRVLLGGRVEEIYPARMLRPGQFGDDQAFGGSAGQHFHNDVFLEEGVHECHKILGVLRGQDDINVAGIGHLAPVTAHDLEAEVAEGGGGGQKRPLVVFNLAARNALQDVAVIFQSNSLFVVENLGLLGLQLRQRRDAFVDQIRRLLFPDPVYVGEDVHGAFFVKGLLFLVQDFERTGGGKFGEFFQDGFSDAGFAHQLLGVCDGPGESFDGFARIVVSFCAHELFARAHDVR